MTGIAAAAVPNDEVGVLGEQIGDLTLALVAPLGPHDGANGHAALLGSASTARTPWEYTSRTIGAELCSAAPRRSSQGDSAMESGRGPDTKRHAEEVANIPDPLTYGSHTRPPTAGRRV